MVFEDYAGQVAPIEWHYWNGDPFYLFDVADVQTRVGYYGVTYVPHFRYDGKKIQDLFGTGPAYPEFFSFFRHTLDSLLAIPSPYRINLQQYPSADWDTVYVSFDVVAVDTIIDDTTPDVYLAVVEKYHTYLTYPEWDYSFRDMVPDADGEAISIQKGDSLHFEWAYPINPIFNADAIITTVFIQNDADMSIPNGKMRNKVMQTAQAIVENDAGVAIGDTRSALYLGQSSPNPFAAETSIDYSLGQAGRVHFSIYSATGQLVRTVVDSDMTPGTYTARWDGRDDRGQEVGSGMYYYRLQLGDQARNGRMVLLK